jgi:fibronectin-binding autotransporter adhesin
MAARYWVGGAGTWSAANTANWSTTSGGAGGASVPTSADTPQFDANSGTGVVTFTNGGVTVGATTINRAGIELSLGAAFATSGALTLTAGILTTNNFNVTAGALSSSNSNTRTISLGSSTVTLTAGPTVVDFGNDTALTFNSGTSNIVVSIGGAAILGGAIVGSTTFYNVSFASTTAGGGVSRACIFNNLSFAGRTTAGVSVASFAANQTINGTLTFSAGTNSTMRTFVRSDILGTQRTLTCAAVAAPTDIDFRDIVIAGAAAPISGTRLGDCKGNSGITFPAGKTVYWRGNLSSNWGASAIWTNSPGGIADNAWFPLAQDTAVFTSTYPTSGNTITINADYNLGNVDMSARTTATMTLAGGTTQPSVYGNWVNGTGITLSGSGVFFFSGQGTQTITSAGRSFSQSFSISGASTNVVMQDALTMSGTNAGFTLNSGTFDANGYNFTMSGSGSTVQASSGTAARTLALGSGTWTVAGSSAATWNTSSSGATITGSGTISLTGFSFKTFTGGGKTYPTLNQGGSGTLTITGNNTFTNITNTYASSGATTIFFQSGSTTTLSNFTASGQSGRVLTISRSSTTNATFSKASGTVSVSFCTITGITATGGATWEAFTSNGNTNGGGSIGWLFTAALATGNMLMMFS